MADQNEQPIIIRKKKGGGHAAHHGGAWKVAYADFVTAMMALFIVLWLMNSSKPVKEAISGYFKDPTGYAKGVGTGQAGTGQGVTIGQDDMGKLKDKLEGAMRELPQFEKIKEQVQFSVTGEGLRVELLESAQQVFFTAGNSVPTGNGQQTLEMLAKELGKLPNSLVIEGHTDSKPYSATGTYSNWELSADRANSARRLMEANGLRNQQVVQVRGFADVDLRSPDRPEDPSNRRVSVIVRYQEPKDEPQQAAGKPAREHGVEKGPAAEHGKAPGA